MSSCENMENLYEKKNSRNFNSCRLKQLQDYLVFFHIKLTYPEAETLLEIILLPMWLFNNFFVF